jgi:hypothetical protein
MKDCTFEWSWQDKPLSRDPDMTRSRLAQLIRTWRRARDRGGPVYTLRIVRRGGGRTVYRVSTPDGRAANFSVTLEGGV